MRVVCLIRPMFTAVAWLCLFSLTGVANATSPYSRVLNDGPAALCQAASAAAEADRRVPDEFLGAIARVETGRPNPLSGAVEPWPWAVNAEGAGTFYETKAQAITAVQALQARGVRSIDVGCLQINLLQHPGAFGSLDQAFDPQANADYAADFLLALFKQTGSWPLAAAAYHSLTPGIGSAYQKRVLAEWATPQNGQRTMATPHLNSTSAPSQTGSRAGSPPNPARPGPDPLASLQAPTTARRSAIAPSGRAGALVQQSATAIRPAGLVGRSLSAYRAMTIPLAFKPLRAPS